MLEKALMEGAEVRATEKATDAAAEGVEIMVVIERCRKGARIVLYVLVTSEKGNSSKSI